MNVQISEAQFIRCDMERIRLAARGAETVGMMSGLRHPPANECLVGIDEHLTAIMRMLRAADEACGARCDELEGGV